MIVTIVLAFINIGFLNEITDNKRNNPNNMIGDNNTKKRIVGYYTLWSESEKNVDFTSINGNLLTHINLAFINIDQKGNLIDPILEGSVTLDDINHFKATYPHVKVLVSVGGWSWSNHFSKVASTQAGRNNFADSTATLLNKYNLDGVDIDWEYPVNGGDSIEHRPSDKMNYTKLVKTTRKKLQVLGRKNKKNYLISIAGGASKDFINNIEADKLMKYLDYINVMTYDYHGGWEKTTGFHTPLYPTIPGEECISTTIDLYLEAGFAPSDLNLGLAFYGRGWNYEDPNIKSVMPHINQPANAAKQKGFGYGTWKGGAFDYWDIEANYTPANGYYRYFDERSKVPYLSNGTTFITYDDIESIGYKLDYVKKSKLGGVMFWEYAGDKNMALQEFISNYVK